MLDGMDSVLMTVMELHVVGKFVNMKVFVIWMKNIQMGILVTVWKILEDEIAKFTAFVKILEDVKMMHFVEWNQQKSNVTVLMDTWAIFAKPVLTYDFFPV